MRVHGFALECHEMRAGDVATDRDGVIDVFAKDDVAVQPDRVLGSGHRDVNITVSRHKVDTEVALNRDRADGDTRFTCFLTGKDIIISYE